MLTKFEVEIKLENAAGVEESKVRIQRDLDSLGNSLENWMNVQSTSWMNN